MLVTYTRIIVRVRSNRSIVGRMSHKDAVAGSVGSTRERHASVARVAPVTNTQVNHTTRNPSITFEATDETSTTDEIPNTSGSARERSTISSVIRQIRNRVPQEYKIARTGFLLVLTFLVLWTPYLVAHSCYNENCSTPTVLNVSMFLVYFNAVANPLVYALTNKTVLRDFRLHFRRPRRS